MVLVVITALVGTLLYREHKKTKKQRSEILAVEAENQRLQYLEAAKAGNSRSSMEKSAYADVHPALRRSEDWDVSRADGSFEDGENEGYIIHNEVDDGKCCLPRSSNQDNED